VSDPRHAGPWSNNSSATMTTPSQSPHPGIITRHDEQLFSCNWSVWSFYASYPINVLPSSVQQTGTTKLSLENQRRKPATRAYAIFRFRPGTPTAAPTTHPREFLETRRTPFSHLQCQHTVGEGHTPCPSGICHAAETRKLGRQ